MFLIPSPNFDKPLEIFSPPRAESPAPTNPPTAVPIGPNIVPIIAPLAAPPKTFLTLSPVEAPSSNTPGPVPPSAPPITDDTFCPVVAG